MGLIRKSEVSQKIWPSGSIFLFLNEWGQKPLDGATIANK